MNESEGDLLTQEEIDALLAELDSGDDAGNLEPAEEAAFTRLLGTVAGAAAPALGIQAPADGSDSEADVEVVSMEEAQEALSGGALVVAFEKPVAATVAVGPGGAPGQAPDEPAVEAAAAEIRKALEETAVGGVDLRAQWQDEPSLGEPGRSGDQDQVLVARWGGGGPVAAATLGGLRGLVAPPQEGGAEVPPAASAAEAAHGAPLQAPPRPAEPAEYPELDPAGDLAPRAAIELLYDVPLEVTAVLGRTRRQIGEVLSLGPGSVLELDKLAGEPVELLVNGKLIARGEVVVIDEHFGVRITDIVSRAERLKKVR